MLGKAFDYKRWADQRTLAAVQSVDADAFPGAHAFARQQLNHMVIVEELFSSRLAGTSAPHSRTNTDTVPALDELERRLLQSNEWYAGYVAALLEEEERIRFLFTDGQAGTMSVGEILFHILTHGSYHRGNIAHALDQAQVPHPIDGYGIYIHEKEPQRRQH